MGMFQLPKQFHPDFKDPQKKPSGRVVVDKSNPYSRGLLHYIISTESGFFDVVTGRHYTITSSNVEQAVAFGEIAVTATASNNDYLITIPTSGVGNYTLATRTRWNEGPNANIISFWKSGGITSEAYLQTNWLDKIDAFAWVGTNRAVSLPEAFSGDGAVIGAGLGGGVLWAQGSGTRSTIAANALQNTIVETRFSAPWDGQGDATSYSFYAVWGRSLTEAEFKRFYSAPYQILKPANDLFYFTAAGGSTSYTLTAESYSVSLAGADVNLYAQHLITISPAGFSLNADSAGLFVNRVMSVSAGIASLAGSDAGLFASRKIAADAGTFSFSAADTGLLFGRKLFAESALFSAVGSPVNLLLQRRLVAESGSFSVVATNVGLSVTGNYSLAAEAGSFVFSGADAALLTQRRLNAESAVFALTGSDVLLGNTTSLLAEAGNYSLAGDPVGLHASRRITCDAGVFSSAFADARLGVVRTMSAQAGSFSQSGDSAQLKANRKSSLDSGQFSFAGMSVSFIYSGMGVFPDLTGVISVVSATPRFTVSSSTPVITVH